MSPTIAVLPPHVVDQIAAGEVIERPASVVKELVDNAIDAGGRTISVEVAGGGRALVRVTDDGCGMSPSDAILAFERHATSKLRAVDDLWGLVSMGFRGEALPSIASVARVVLTTRRESDLAATRVVIEGSKLISASEVGAPVGTTVEVADLLYNVPARLKFLKGEATEASHVTDLVAKIALAHPHLHVRLRYRVGAGARTALELPPDRDGFARVQAVLGARVASRMVPVSGDEGGIKIAAYLGAPELAQATAKGVQLFVGKRAVRDRGVLHALAMGYGELIPRGRYPVAVVHLDLPAGAVDINVHPQKHEVRFADPPAVAAAIRHVVQTGVAAAQWRAEVAPIQMSAISSTAAPALPFDGMATPLAQRYARELRARSAFGGLRGGARPERDPNQASLGLVPDTGKARAWVSQIHRQSEAKRASEARAAAQYARATRDGFADTQPAGGDDLQAALRAKLAENIGDPSRSVLGDSAMLDGSDPSRAFGDDPSRAFGGDHPSGAMLEGALFDESARHLDGPGIAIDADRPARFPTGSGPVTEARGYFAQLRYLGQLDLTYLVCEAHGELVLVDQHAAHERVELARLIARQAHADDGRAGQPAIQKLLFPMTIDATPKQLELVAQMGPLLAAVGYEAEAFGKGTLALKTVPAGIRHGDPAQLLRSLLDEWATEGAPSEEERLIDVLAKIACHSVVRAGDRLAANEAEALLASLDGIDPSTPVAHGRSLLLRLPLAEIGRRFGR